MSNQPNPLRVPASAASSSLTDGDVANFLLSRQLFAAALEMHQELLERNNGLHAVAPLNTFFHSADTFRALLAETDAKAAQNKANGGWAGGWLARVMPPHTLTPPSPLLPSALGHAMQELNSPFAVDGLQPAVAARDQHIALLEYQLRCATADAEALRSELAAQAGASATASASAESPAQRGSVRLPAPESGGVWACADEDGTPITPGERRTLNALVRRYLLARGYKAAAVALTEEVDAHADAGGAASADSHLLALPGTRRSPSAVLSLLSMHRKRIAPIQALAESGAKSDSAAAALREQLASALEQLAALQGESAEARARVVALEQEVAIARARSASSGGGGANRSSQQPSPTLGGVSGHSLSLSGLPPLGGPRAPPPSALQSTHAPALLKLLGEGLPLLSRSIVTTQRSAIIPLLSAAAAAESSPESRRSLLSHLLLLLRRPTHAERCVIRAQVCVLAGRLGPHSSDSELLPEVMLLSKTGHTRERKALSAVLAGALAPYVSERRTDGLLATLADLSDSPHAVVRVGVVDGLTSLAATLTKRWAHTLASGAVQGTGTAVELAVLRQFHAIRELMWKLCLSATEEEDGVDMAAAAASEFALGVPPALALYGVVGGAASIDAGSSFGPRGEGTHLCAELPPPTAAAEAAPAPVPVPGRKLSIASAGGDKPLVEGGVLPQCWGVQPSSASAAVAAGLMPVLITWAHKLGVLWRQFLPGVLGLLGDTLHQTSQADGALVSFTGGAGGPTASKTRRPHTCPPPN